jgi:hypothetical protein
MVGFLKAGSRGKAPGGVSGVSPESLSPFAPEGGALKNIHLRGCRGTLSGGQCGGAPDLFLSPMFAAAGGMRQNLNSHPWGFSPPEAVGFKPWR